MMWSSKDIHNASGEVMQEYDQTWLAEDRINVRSRSKVKELACGRAETKRQEFHYEISERGGLADQTDHATLKN